MNLLSILDFTGRLHPVFVHLPIGILLLACLFQWLMIRSRFAVLQPAVSLALGLGALSAIASCITGFLLSQSGDYDEQLVGRHQWLGISVAVVATALYVLHKRAVKPVIARWSSLVLVALVSFTGHLGGSLTHGSDYLSEGLNSSAQPKGPAIKPIPNIQEAEIYASAIQPLLQARCYSCHGPNKMKGKLRLDKPEFILKGGETGKTVVPGKSDESELSDRLLLPLEEDNHMPPKEKAQLTRQEIELMHWWINSGADFTKKFKDAPQTDKIKPVLLALQTGSSAEEKILNELPPDEVKKADGNAISSLAKAGVIITQVAQNSNYLSVSFVTALSVEDSIIKLLQPLKSQLLWLNLSNTAIDDNDLKEIAKLENLTRLNLNGVSVTDKGLAELKKLSHLRYLNLVGTKVAASGVQELKELKDLQSIYLYQSGVKPADWPELKKAFPKTILDSGGYFVPTLAQDTTEIKY